MDKAILKATLKAMADKIASLIGGGYAWLIAKVLYYGGQYAIDYVNDLIWRMNRKKNQEKKLEELKKIEKDPKSTPEDIAKAYQDFINQRD